MIIRHPHVGDILLNDGRHVAVCVAAGMVSEASINELGKANGGKPGDQTDLETRTRRYYSYPWSCYLRYAGARTRRAARREPAERPERTRARRGRLTIPQRAGAAAPRVRAAR